MSASGVCKKRWFFCASLWLVLAFAGCGNHSIALNGPPASGPLLSWTAAWSPGSHAGPIAFQSAGQTATVTATSGPGFLPPPYQVAVAGYCAATSSTTMTATLTVTAAAPGSCTIEVSPFEGETSYIGVTVP